MMTSPAERINLLDLSNDELISLVVSWGQPRFRAAQIWRWVYHSLTADYAEMGNLPAALRERLAEETVLGRLEPVDVLYSDDRLTEKTVFRTSDDHFIETVLMRYTSRNTICVHTDRLRAGVRFLRHGPERLYARSDRRRNLGPVAALRAKAGRAQCAHHQRGVHGYGRAATECRRSVAGNH